MRKPLDYSKLSDEEIQTELEKGYTDIKEGRCAYIDEAFDNIRRRCNVKTKEEHDEISLQEERLHQLLTEQSEELQEEIIAFFEEGKNRKTIWERIRGVFRK